MCLFRLCVPLSNCCLKFSVFSRIRGRFSCFVCRSRFVSWSRFVSRFVSGFVPWFDLLSRRLFSGCISWCFFSGRTVSRCLLLLSRHRHLAPPGPPAISPAPAASTPASAILIFSGVGGCVSRVSHTCSDHRQSFRSKPSHQHSSPCAPPPLFFFPFGKPTFVALSRFQI